MLPGALSSHTIPFDDDTIALRMVLLTMNAAIVEALDQIQGLQHEEAAQLPPALTRAANPENSQHQGDPKDAEAGKKTNEEPSLFDPKIGNPISHSQIIDLSRQLKEQGLPFCSLELLLRGSRVYIPPSPPKPEPVSRHIFQTREWWMRCIKFQVV